MILSPIELQAAVTKLRYAAEANSAIEVVYFRYAQSPPNGTHTIHDFGSFWVCLFLCAWRSVLGFVGQGTAAASGIGRQTADAPGC